MLVTETAWAASTDVAVFIFPMGGNSVASLAKVFVRAPASLWTKMGAKSSPGPMSMTIWTGSLRSPFAMAAS